MELSGINDAKACAGGAASGCVWTAIGLIPQSRALKIKATGKVGKAVLKYSDEIADLPASQIVNCHLKSFSGDTKVLMADGSAKPIADVKVGDLGEFSQS